MNLRKKLIAVAAVAAMTAAAIYGSTLKINSAVEDRIPWFGNKETIYFWYSDEALSGYINSAAVAFGEREGVRVIPVLTSESEYLEAVNRASLQDTQAPDAYILSNDSLEKAYLAGLAEEVEDAAGICNEEHFPPAALSAVTYRGKIVGYPLYYETSALVYNETYLREWARQQAEKELAGIDTEGVGNEEPQNAEGAEKDASAFDETMLIQKTEEYFTGALPDTIDDILNIADTFDAPEGVEVMEWDVSDIFYNYWIVGNYMIVGGDAGDDKNRIAIDNQETIQCLEVYKALNQFFSIEPDQVDYDSSIQDFIEGKIMFTIGTTDVAKRLQEARENGSLVYDYGITLMPRVSEELESRSLSVTNVVVVNSYSGHRELADRFASYLTEEYAGGLYERTGKAAACSTVDTGNGALQVFFMEYADSIPLPKMMETGNFWMQLEVLFSKVWNGADVNAQVQELAGQMAIQAGG